MRAVLLILRPFSLAVASANVTGMNFSSTATYGVSGTISGPGGNGATVSLAGAATVAGSSNMVLYSQFDRRGFAGDRAVELLLRPRHLHGQHHGPNRSERR